MHEILSILHVKQLVRAHGNLVLVPSTPPNATTTRYFFMQIRPTNTIEPGDSGYFFTLELAQNLISEEFRVFSDFFFKIGTEKYFYQL